MKKIKFHIVYTFCLLSTLILLVSCHTGEKSTKAFSFPLNEITIDEIHHGYDSGRYTVKEIVSQYINRINNIDQEGPEINSVIIVNPDAVKLLIRLIKFKNEEKIKVFFLAFQYCSRTILIHMIKCLPQLDLEY